MPLTPLMASCLPRSVFNFGDAAAASSGDSTVAPSGDSSVELSGDSVVAPASSCLCLDTYTLHVQNRFHLLEVWGGVGADGSAGVKSRVMLRLFNRVELTEKRPLSTVQLQAIN